MNPQLLNLNLSQLVRAWSKSKDNSYSDKRKQVFHDRLGDLFKQLKNQDFGVMNDDERRDVRNIISFFQNCLELLDGNTINYIPFELIECLKTASADWLDDHDQYIILTSFGDYAVLYLDYSPLYQLIKTKFGVEFETELIQIRLPKYLYRDYLTNVVLYHEIGHFVDFKLKISPAFTQEIFNSYLHKEPNIIEQIYQYFPFLTDTGLSDIEKYQIMTSHAREYFSDLFAAQYIGLYINEHLTYIEGERPNIRSKTHPCLSNRVKIVDDFIKERADNLVLEKIKEVLFRITTKKIEKRFIDLSPDDFFNLIPYVITTKKDLHSLFRLGWDIWLNKTELFKEKNKMVEDILPSQVYTIINNLIEKSINNFIIRNLWTKNNK